MMSSSSVSDVSLPFAVTSELDILPVFTSLPVMFPLFSVVSVLSLPDSVAAEFSTVL